MLADRRFHGSQASMALKASQTGWRQCHFRLLFVVCEGGYDQRRRSRNYRVKQTSYRISQCRLYLKNSETKQIKRLTLIVVKKFAQRMCWRRWIVICDNHSVIAKHKIKLHAARDKYRLQRVQIIANIKIKYVVLYASNANEYYKIVVQIFNVLHGHKVH